MSGYSLKTTSLPLSGLSDPLETRGDLIVRSATDWTRLPLGANTFVLSSDGVDAVWAAAGGGGLTDITESTDGLTYVALSVNTVDADFVVTPNGNGGLASVIHDGTATGGNALGTQAVDLQLRRSLATEAATGAWSTISGGARNKATNSAACVTGGWQNNALGQYSVVAGGLTNTATSSYSAVLGGSSNNAASSYAGVVVGISNKSQASSAVVVGGGYNVAFGAYSVVLGGVATRTDHPASVAWSGNSLGFSTTQWGKSQGQLVHLDQQTTSSTPTTMDSIGTELKLTVNGLFSVTGTVGAWNVTDGTATDWTIRFLVKNVGGVLTLIGGGGAQVINFTDDAGVPALAISITSTTIRFTVTGIALKTMRWSGTLIMSRATS